MKKSFISFLMATASVVAVAQNATNSPYSQFGLGQLADQSNGAAVGMGGLSMGWREGNTVNFANPASYAGTDSITMVFDAGISLQRTNFQEGGRKLNANNSSFDYIVGAFRLFPRVGLGFGVMPYSNVGYSYGSTEKVPGTQDQNGNFVSSQCTYSGSGGIHQIFLGVGVDVIRSKNTTLAVGVNGSYAWGDYTKQVANVYDNSAVMTRAKYHTATVKSYKLDFALQFRQRLTSTDVLTVGAVFSPGHDMDSNPTCYEISTNTQTGVADTLTYKADGLLRMPTSFGAGFVLNHAGKVRVGFDWKQEQWGAVKFPQYDEVDGKGQYAMTGGLFKNRQKYIVGCEYTPSENGRTWAGRIRYRVGLNYTTPYLVIDGKDGPKEYGVSAGIGLPIINNYNNRSVLNISASWTKVDCKTFIKENVFRINIGLTFNERWFAKWQAQ